MLPAGSQVKTGFNIGVQTATASMTQGIADDLSNTIEGCVYATGGFSSVSVAVTWHYFSELVYVTVAVETVNDHADIEDVGTWIQGAIQSCVPDVEIVSKDRTVGVGAVDSSGNPLPQGNTPPGAPPPSQCNWDAMTLGDYLACQTGVTKSTALIVGAVLAVGVIYAVSKR